MKKKTENILLGLWWALSIALISYTTITSWNNTLDTYLQLFASFSGLLVSHLIIKGKRENFIWGILNCIVWGYISFNTKLYFDALMQIFYIIIGVFSFIKWQKGINVFQNKKINWKLALPLTAVMLGLGFLIKDSSPVLDTINLVLAVVSAITLLEKDYKTFIIWIVGDLIMVAAYWSVPIMAATYFLFFVVAVIGLLKFRAQERNENQ